MTLASPSSSGPNAPRDASRDPEVLSLFDARTLAHLDEDIARIEAARAHFDVHGWPRIVEIGANRGAFLEGQARAYADQAVLGIEWRAKLCRIAEERFAKRGIDNAYILHANARLAIPLLFGAGSLDAVHVLFPDPWWKARHVRRRVIDPMFLRILARRLDRRGAFFLKSDVFDYLYMVRVAAERSEAMRALPADRWPDERAWAPSTREKKCMNAAIPFGRGYYTRRADFAVEAPNAPESAADFAMPDEIDPIAIIKGAPPIDRASKGRRR